MARQATSKPVTELKSSKSRPSDAELNQAIAKKAYELFQKRGYSHGNDWQDWLEAERLVKKQYNAR